ncbi:MAG: hypothetical protein B0D92_05565 [Spirochaeta sp. LUC14_002_19_P3]|nr:MAG: hypothetical protein B0D92_05565 [Spirochaeta sp. LUC14_002_19_P3]
MPPPEIIAEYAKLHPKAPEFFFNAVAKQIDHRITLEKDVVNSNIKNERLGQIFAFIICMSVIIGGVYLVSIDKDTAGISAVLGSLVGLVSLFFARKRHNRKELNSKDL